MSASPKTCKSLTARLQGLNFLPWHDQGAVVDVLTELKRTLESSADDDAHAERIVEAWLKDNCDRPTPADLKRLAAQTRQRETGPPAGCSMCHGEPWVFEDVVIYGDRITAAGRCNCARGQWFSAKDHEHEAQSRQRGELLRSL